MTPSSASNGPVASTSNSCVIGTHDGVFHADDVCAVAALTIVHPDAALIRTRDADRLAKADVVVDVGGVYDPDRGRFDHHQRGRAGGRENGVLYSSFGLVWRHYASRVLSALGVPEEHWSAVGGQVDLNLVQPVDATDNGQNLYAGGKAVFKDVATVSLSSVLSGFNPSWHLAERDFDRAFGQAVGFAQAILRNQVSAALGEALARSVVAGAIDRADGGPVVILDQFVPWGEQVRDDAPHALFTVFPSETGTWMVQAVNARAGTFESRKLLPESWAGLRDADFCAITGVEDGVFCHPGRFICGARSKASALKLARLALSEAGPPTVKEGMFWRFRQNNAGGVFVGPHNLIVFAASEDDAVAALSGAGLFAGFDCDCCGRRWSRSASGRYEDLEAAVAACRRCNADNVSDRDLFYVLSRDS